jgi:hypothetical protein
LNAFVVLCELTSFIAASLNRMRLLPGQGRAAEPQMQAAAERDRDAIADRK